MAVNGHFQAPAVYLQKRSIRYPLVRWLGGPRCQSGCTKLPKYLQKEVPDCLRFVMFICGPFLKHMFQFQNGNLV
jgi:hypothetical protein